MRWLILAEIAFAAVTGIVFTLRYGWLSEWRSSPMGRHMLVYNAVIAGELISLLALAVWPVPLWVYAVVFGALDAVQAQRLSLLWRIQRDSSREE